MSIFIPLRESLDRRDDRRPPPSHSPMALAWRRRRPEAIYGVGLWVFMGVATALFSLFITSYIMRMSSNDAAAIALPHQLWISTTWLVLGSVLLQLSAVRARIGDVSRARTLLLCGGICAAAFLAVQWWAWQALLAQQVTPVGNPGGSFFYLLTAMHGLHVMGGLIGWTMATRAVKRDARAAEAAWRIALCARYWHFLLVVWLALYATLSLITPEVARIICRTA